MASIPPTSQPMTIVVQDIYKSMVIWIIFVLYFNHLQYIHVECSYSFDCVVTGTGPNVDPDKRLVRNKPVAQMVLIANFGLHRPGQLHDSALLSNIKKDI